MFDLTDDIENSPNTTQKAKPVEVKPIPEEDKEYQIPKQPEEKKPEKDEDGTTIEYYDTKNGDDSQW